MIGQVAYHHIPAYGACDISFLQAMSIASSNRSIPRISSGLDRSTTGITDASIPTHVTITQGDIEDANNATTSYEDSFFPAGSMKPPKEPTRDPVRLNGKLLQMKVDDPNQMLMTKQLDTF